MTFIPESYFHTYAKYPANCGWYTPYINNGCFIWKDACNTYNDWFDRPNYDEGLPNPVLWTINAGDWTVGKTYPSCLSTSDSGAEIMFAEYPAISGFAGNYLYAMVTIALPTKSGSMVEINNLRIEVEQVEIPEDPMMGTPSYVVQYTTVLDKVSGVKYSIPTTADYIDPSTGTFSIGICKSPRNSTIYFYNRYNPYTPDSFSVKTFTDDRIIFRTLNLAQGDSFKIHGIDYVYPFVKGTNGGSSQCMFCGLDPCEACTDEGESNSYTAVVTGLGKPWSFCDFHGFIRDYRLGSSNFSVAGGIAGDPGSPSVSTEFTISGTSDLGYIPFNCGGDECHFTSFSFSDSDPLSFNFWNYSYPFPCRTYYNDYYIIYTHGSCGLSAVKADRSWTLPANSYVLLKVVTSYNECAYLNPGTSAYNTAVTQWVSFNGFTPYTASPCGEDALTDFNGTYTLTPLYTGSEYTGYAPSCIYQSEEFIVPKKCQQEETYRLYLIFYGDTLHSHQSAGVMAFFAHSLEDYPYRLTTDLTYSTGISKAGGWIDYNNRNDTPTLTVTGHTVTLSPFIYKRYVVHSHPIYGYIDENVLMNSNLQTADIPNYPWPSGMQIEVYLTPNGELKAAIWDYLNMPSDFYQPVCSVMYPSGCSDWYYSNYLGYYSTRGDQSLHTMYPYLTPNEDMLIVPSAIYYADDILLTGTKHFNIDTLTNGTWRMYFDGPEIKAITNANSVTNKINICDVTIADSIYQAPQSSRIYRIASYDLQPNFLSPLSDFDVKLNDNKCVLQLVAQPGKTIEWYTGYREYWVGGELDHPDFNVVDSFNYTFGRTIGYHHVYFSYYNTNPYEVVDSSPTYSYPSTVVPIATIQVTSSGVNFISNDRRAPTSVKHGFDDPAGFTYDFTHMGLTTDFRMKPVGHYHDIWVYGNKFTKDDEEICSFTPGTGLHNAYYDTAGNLRIIEGNVPAYCLPICQFTPVRSRYMSTNNLTQSITQSIESFPTMDCYHFNGLTLKGQILSGTEMKCQITSNN